MDPGFRRDDGLGESIRRWLSCDGERSIMTTSPVSFSTTDGIATITIDNNLNHVGIQNILNTIDPFPRSRNPKPFFAPSPRLPFPPSPRPRVPVSPRPRVPHPASHRLPYPPDRGDRIRSYHLLKLLSQHFDVSIACTSDEPVWLQHHHLLRVAHHGRGDPGRDHRCGCSRRGYHVRQHG